MTKRYMASLFCALFFLAWIAIDANAQASGKAAVQSHLAAAKAAAYEPGNDLTTLYDTVCAPALSDRGPREPDIQALAESRAPQTGPRSEWHTEPGKAFDNLYYIGSPFQSTWAVTTSEGIILIDSGYDYSAKELITDGLKKLHLDPTQIKYVVLTHVHGDRFYGARYLQDTYKARIIMSEADWNVMTRTNDPSELKPKKDMVATDGMKLTLGDTTLTLYITPGHTPGTISILVPLKDGNERHVGAVWGGINADVGRNGVRYFPSMAETFKTWIASARRFQDIAAKANADVYLTLHPFYDKALDKLHALNFRKPGGPNPFVSKDNLNRFLTIIRECTEAELARINS
ncbi:MAG: MBL fold metallo-hydrolase [Acidobacteria bacterium]|nr:MAG: MBL fold metallo-hydrolase [Acidobacteriota bacterium]